MSHSSPSIPEHIKGPSFLGALGEVSKIFAIPVLAIAGGIAVDAYVDHQVKIDTAPLQDQVDTLEGKVSGLCDGLRIIFDESGPHFAPSEENTTSATPIPFEKFAPDC